MITIGDGKNCSYTKYGASYSKNHCGQTIFPSSVEKEDDPYSYAKTNTPVSIDTAYVEKLIQKSFPKKKEKSVSEETKVEKVEEKKEQKS